MKVINLGILAHVDAGKTSLTERLLYTTGVIDKVGSVDRGNTQTDSLALERQRGITIKSAVASFVIDDRIVNLIDTPGHPDFIDEVQRVLNVLDGVVLVISAVEGVQAQTRVLMRALQRLRIPTLLFVNKIDRNGAQYERLLQDISAKLTPNIIAMGSVRGLGTREAFYRPYTATDADFALRLVDLLADHDEALFAAYVADETSVSFGQLRDALAMQTKRALIHPVFFGSAMTGAGIDPLLKGIAALLPPAADDGDGAVSGTVFKIERSPTGEKIAYVRMFTGTIRVRERLPFGQGKEGKITDIHGFTNGLSKPQAAITAGQIGKIWGIGDVQIGDAIGSWQKSLERRHFAPPTLETVIVPRRSTDKGRLHMALAQLAEQDPLINLRQDDTRQEISISLYGEVQKEVIQETLKNDFHIDVEFRETTTIHIERPVGSGAAVEIIGKESNPFLATVGLRIDPAPINTGVDFQVDIKVESIPLFLYNTVEDFRKAMANTVRRTLAQGLYGWQVTDCLVTLTLSGYISPASTARDFRLLTPLVLMSALKQADTMVCEPIHRFHLEMPADTFGRIWPILARLRAVPQTPTRLGSAYALDGEMPATRIHELQGQLLALTRGEGLLECTFDHYEPIRGAIPTRPRSDHNPLNRKEYLLHVVRRV
ncbi:GTP-binding protein [Alicyclobacillus fodiniaquatilis]|uniref:GTP-binding protein n=1 Tax=Alicyclobacillus fodiniaquatilis TaxID=1661150 RepID=A0ABW4JPH0_9BACL